MTGNETVKAMKADKSFEGATIDVNVRQQLVCVITNNQVAIEKLLSWGFVDRGDHFAKSWKINLAQLENRTDWVKVDHSQPDKTPDWALS